MTKYQYFPTSFLKTTPSILKITAMLTLGLSGSAAAEAWQFQISPYLYLPNMNSQIHAYKEYSTSLSRPFSEVYSSIDGAYFIQATAQKGHWIFLGDAHHVKLSEQGVATLPNGLALKASGTFKYSAVTAMSGYHFTPTPHSDFYAELLAGARYWSFKNNFTLSLFNGAISRSESMQRHWIEPVIALRTSYAISSRWSLLGYVDSSLFSENHSWQIGAISNYKFGDHWIASAGYKWEHIKPHINNVDVKTDLDGLILGITYQF